MSQTFEHEIMREARTLARLQARGRRLRADLKANAADIRAAKRALRSLINAKSTADYWPESGAASRLLGTKAGD